MALAFVPCGLSDGFQCTHRSATTFKPPTGEVNHRDTYRKAGSWHLYAYCFYTYHHLNIVAENTRPHSNGKGAPRDFAAPWSTVCSDTVLSESAFSFSAILATVSHLLERTTWAPTLMIDTRSQSRTQHSRAP